MEWDKGKLIFIKTLFFIFIGLSRPGNHECENLDDSLEHDIKNDDKPNPRIENIYKLALRLSIKDLNFTTISRLIYVRVENLYFTTNTFFTEKNVYFNNKYPHMFLKKHSPQPRSKLFRNQNTMPLEKSTHTKCLKIKYII